LETIRTLTPDDMPAAWTLDREVFNVDAKLHETARDPDGADRFVGAFDGDTLVAICEFHRFGQFFGGRRIPMGGVASVVVSPEARGRGLATRMMRFLLERMRDERLPISALYPATPALYRSLGYEFAGEWTRYSAPVARLRDVRRPERGRVRRATVDDLPAIEALRVTLAREHPGAIDRGDWALPIYRRRFEDLHTFVSLDEAGEIDGALFYRHAPIPPGTLDYDLDVRELFAADATSLSTLLWVIASASSVARNLLYRGWPDDPAAWLVPELKPSIAIRMRWMLRLLDVPAALEARGAPAGLSGGVGLRVHDPLLGDNQADFGVTFEGGAARVTRGSTDSPVELDIGALSALYSGHTSCAALARAGRLGGGDPARDWAMLEAAFSGIAPAMVDDF
jgi:predicted acetyltransferase